MDKRKNLPYITALIITCFLFCTVVPVSAGDGISRYWAVIVGISDYQNINDLKYADNDSTSFYNLLIQDSRWEESRMTLLENSQASRAAIENAITIMAENSDEDDIVLFFFSGHGGQANEDFIPLDETDGMDEYLVCWDSTTFDYSGDITDDDLGEVLSGIGGTTIVLIDACFSGGHLKTVSQKSDSIGIQELQEIKFVKKPFEQQAGTGRTGDGFASDLFNRFSALKDAGDQAVSPWRIHIFSAPRPEV